MIHAHPIGVLLVHRRHVRPLFGGNRTRTRIRRARPDTGAPVGVHAVRRLARRDGEVRRPLHAGRHLDVVEIAVEVLTDPKVLRRAHQGDVRVVHGVHQRTVAIHLDLVVERVQGDRVVEPVGLLLHELEVVGERRTGRGVVDQLRGDLESDVVGVGGAVGGRLDLDLLGHAIAIVEDAQQNLGGHERVVGVLHIDVTTGDVEARVGGVVLVHAVHQLPPPMNSSSRRDTGGIGAVVVCEDELRNFDPVRHVLRRREQDSPLRPAQHPRLVRGVHGHVGVGEQVGGGGGFEHRGRSDTQRQHVVALHGQIEHAALLQDASLTRRGGVVPMTHPCAEGGDGEILVVVGGARNGDVLIHRSVEAHAAIVLGVTRDATRIVHDGAVVLAGRAVEGHIVRTGLVEAELQHRVHHVVDQHVALKVPAICDLLLRDAPRKQIHRVQIAHEAVADLRHQRSGCGHRLRRRGMQRHERPVHVELGGTDAFVGAHRQMNPFVGTDRGRGVRDGVRAEAQAELVVGVQGPIEEAGSPVRHLQQASRHPRRGGRHPTLRGQHGKVHIDGKRRRHGVRNPETDGFRTAHLTRHDVHRGVVGRSNTQKRFRLLVMRRIVHQGVNLALEELALEKIHIPDIADEVLPHHQIVGVRGRTDVVIQYATDLRSVFIKIRFATFFGVVDLQMRPLVLLDQRHKVRLPLFYDFGVLQRCVEDFEITHFSRKIIVRDGCVTDREARLIVVVHVRRAVHGSQKRPVLVKRNRTFLFVYCEGELHPVAGGGDVGVLYAEHCFLYYYPRIYIINAYTISRFVFDPQKRTEP